jgi:hypothetical protein
VSPEKEKKMVYMPAYPMLEGGIFFAPKTLQRKFWDFQRVGYPDFAMQKSGFIWGQHDI